MKRICVFCGAASGHDPLYAATAATLGQELAARGIELVTGGGKVGLMGAVADAALAAGGAVTGVIPRGLEEREVAHRGLTRLHVVETLHERKELMHRLSDAFVALPGGFGTLDELMETITWAQLGLHAKPIGLVNAGGLLRPPARVRGGCRGARLRVRRAPGVSRRGRRPRVGARRARSRVAQVAAGHPVRSGARRSARDGSPDQVPTMVIVRVSAVAVLRVGSTVACTSCPSRPSGP